MAFGGSQRANLHGATRCASRLNQGLSTIYIGIGRVWAYSVTPDVPDDLQGQLPGSDRVASLLAGFEDESERSYAVANR